MTEHEDLIAEARDLAEMSRETRHGVPSHCDMIDSLADSLEKVSAERDEVRRADKFLRMERVASKENLWRAEKAEAERDEALKEADLSAQERGRLIEERDGLSSLREQMSLRLRYVEGKREQSEAERDQLAAVVERVGRENAQASDGERFSRVRYALMSAPSVALDRVKAEARAEGVHEARAYIQRITPAGLVDRASVLADLEIAAERLSQGIHANGRDRIEKGESDE